MDGLHPCYLACLHLCTVSRSLVVISGLVAATHESPEGLAVLVCTRVAHKFGRFPLLSVLSTSHRVMMTNSPEELQDEDNVEKGKLLFVAGEHMQGGVQPLWKSVLELLKSLKVELPSSPVCR